MKATVMAAGAINAALAIAASAFAAHGLESLLATEAITARQFDAFETGADHHLYHAIAMILAGLAWPDRPGGSARSFWVAGCLFFAGILMFSGSLYLYGTLGSTGVIWITPIGGIANIAGWLTLAFAMVRVRKAAI